MDGREPTARPTWSVASTTIEPAALVEAFAAHHLALGADRVFVFLDDPADSAGFAFAPDSSVVVIPCDDAHWAGRSQGRPSDHRARQCWNVEHAARSLCRSDWIAHLDADELLLPRGGRSIADLLATVPADVPALRVRPAERAVAGGWDEAGLDLRGVFKVWQHGSRLGWRIYSRPTAAAFPGGFQGHEVGKSFRRTARDDLRFRIHRVMTAEGSEAPVALPTTDEALLLHLFPTSFADWRSKYERRLGKPGALSAMTARERRKFEAYRDVVAAGGEVGERRLFEELCTVARPLADELVAEGLAVEPDLPRLAQARAALNAHLLIRGFDDVRRVARVPPGPRAILVGMDLCDERDICRHFAARGYSYAHAGDGRLDRELETVGVGSKPVAEFEGVHLLSGLGIEADLARLADLQPEAVLILNHRPVADWLTSRAARAASGGVPSEAIPAEWAEQWQRRVEAFEAIRRQGRRALEWRVELDKPCHLFRTLAEWWGLPP